jgi:error-prone DNA polymerase
LWQAERVVRPAGELFDEVETVDAREHVFEPRETLSSPLPAMTPTERLVADYAGTSLTIGPHPMSFRRHELSMRGIMPASELPQIRTGRRVRTAGMVITRQRPGTAKGFVFLTLEDETGVANIIVRPDFYAAEKVTLVEAPFLIVEGIVQTEDGVTAIRAEKVWRLDGLSGAAAIESHDFH